MEPPLFSKLSPATITILPCAVEPCDSPPAVNTKDPATPSKLLPVCTDIEPELPVVASPVLI